MGFFAQHWRFQAFFQIRVSKCLDDFDAQLWRSSGNDGWATMKRLEQQWDFLRNIGDSSPFSKFESQMSGQL